MSGISSLDKSVPSPRGARDAPPYHALLTSHPIPFVLHILIELPAGINFFLNPTQQLQLPSASSAAEAVIRQYALLLLVSCIIALIFALRPIDVTSRRVAGSLALYHILPLYRATSRLLAGQMAIGGGLGGPLVHAAVHSACLIALFLLYIS